MKIKKINFCFAFVIGIFLLLNILVIFSGINKKNIQNNIFRLHVVANSNTDKDQNLKLKVAKALSNFLHESNIKGYLNSKEKAKQYITDNINKILEIANSVIKQNGYDYNVYANIGEMKYDEKSNETIQMAKGTYDSIKLVIGDGKGQNFWSLIYPYSYIGSYEFKNNTKDINKNVIVDTNFILNEEDITYEFKIVELLKNIF